MRKQRGPIKIHLSHVFVRPTLGPTGVPKGLEKRLQEIGDNVILDGINDGEISVEVASFMKIMFDKQLENEKAGKPMPDILKNLGL